MESIYTEPSIPLKEQQELLLKSSNDVILMMDSQLRVFLSNDAALNTLGFSKNSEIRGAGLHAALSAGYEAKIVSGITEICAEAFRNLKPYSYSDSHVEAFVTASSEAICLCISDQTGKGRKFCKTNILLSMSHEIRTPMNAIMGMSNLLSLTQLNDIQAHYLNNVLTAAESLLKTINNIIALSEIDENKFKPMNTEYELASLLRAAASAAGAKASEKKLDFFLDVAADLPLLLVGDNLRINQILSSLLDNAIKYTDTGYVKLLVSGEHKKDDELLIKFSVEDTGIGIENKDSLFELDPFFQEAALRTNASSGTGGGFSLAISKTMANSLDGDLYVQSQFGEGSVFTLELPQLVKSNEKLAYVKDFSKKKVLLFSSSPAGKGLEKMLCDLFIPYHVICNETEFLELIAKDDYTHVIYWDSKFGAFIEGHRDKLASKRMIAVKELAQNASEISTKVSLLFEPVLISDLASVLDMPLSSGIGRSFENLTQNKMGSFQLENTEILVVDDNEVNLIVAEEMLKTYGATLDVAISGRAAIELCNRKKYDIIFMDHMMPGMDGVEATANIRAGNSEYSAVPIIAFTANSFDDMREWFLSNQMNDFISKPIEIDELNRVLETWLPKEKLIYEKKAEIEGYLSDNEELFKKLNEINGIEPYLALREFEGSEKIYLAVLTTFVSTLPSKTAKLEMHFESGDMENYRIEIHSLKSSLANVGQYELSEIAKRFEVSLRNNQVEYLNKNHAKFVSDLKALGRRLELALGSSVNKSGAGQGDMQNIKTCESLLLALKSGLDMLDTEAVDTVMEKFKSMNLDKSSSDSLRGISMYVNEFDYELALLAVESILK